MINQTFLIYIQRYFPLGSATQDTEVVSYEDYCLIEAIPKTNDSVKLLRDMEGEMGKVCTLYP